MTRFIAAFRGVLHYSKLLRNTLADLRPSIIHTNGIKCHVISSLVDFPDAPVLWQIQDFVGPRPVVNRALRWASRSTAGAIAISEAVSADIQGVTPQLPTTVIYSAIDTDHFSPSADHPYDMDALAGLPPAPAGTLRIALVAAYARWKGQDIFIDAIAKILADYPDAPARFFIVGGPIYKTQGSQFSIEELRAQAHRLNIAPTRIGFVPFQQDVAQVYRSVDICVHASKQPEPFGRTIVEAMATAKPVIVTQAGGAAELFTPGHDALGVPPGNATAMAAAITRLLRDPELRASLSANARHSAVTKFSRDRMAPEFIALYERTMSLHATARKALIAPASPSPIAELSKEPVVTTSNSL